MGVVDRIRNVFGRNGNAQLQNAGAGEKIKVTVGEKTPRNTFGTFGGVLNFGDLVSRQARDWFGPHSPTNIPVWVLELMRRDPTIALTMRARRAILMSADYRYEHDDDEIKAACQKQLDRHKDRLLADGLLSLELGFIPIELVWGVEDMSIKTIAKDTGLRETTLKNLFVVTDIRAHDPNHTSIVVDDFGDLLELRVGADKAISKTRSILYTHQSEFGKLHGRSGMLPAYNPWWHKNVLIQNANTYFEQKGNPIYIGRAPDAAEWKALQTRGGTPDQIPNFDPVNLVNTVIVNALSGGAVTLPSMMRTTEDGTPTNIPMFDVKVLEVPNRKDEFVGYMNYLDLLQVRGCMGNELVVLVGSPGQAGAKQGGRLFHSMLRPDQEEWAHQTNEQFINPFIDANFGEDTQKGRIISGAIAENKAEMAIDLFKAIFDVTQRTPDGRTYLAGELVNVQELLKGISIPTHDVDLVASDEPNRKPKRPEGRPPSDKGDDVPFDSDDE